MRVLVTVLLVATLAQGQSLTPKGTADIDALFQRAVEQGTVPGVVAIVATKDRILYHNAFGLQEVASRKPMLT